MTSNAPAVSFDSIVKAGRERKKAEKLAASILGKGRRESAPPSGPKAKAISSPSLASRITKPGQRSASSSSLNRSQVEIAYKKAAKLNGAQRDGQSNAINGHTRGQGFSIKGAAGPYVVVGSNFAPGTSAADIRSAMEPVAGEIMSCVVITSNPTVIVELVYAEKGAAEMIINTFNNQKADGRLLHLYLKHGPPTKLEPPVPIVPPAAPSAPSIKPSDDRSDLFSDRSGGRAPRHTSSNLADPEYQDGRFGFDVKGEDMDVDYQAEPEESRRDYRDSTYQQNSRYDRRPYRQDYPRATNPRLGDYSTRRDQSRPEQRPSYNERLYSDRLYSDSRNGSYGR